jgi:hypothetical protein
VVFIYGCSRLKEANLSFCKSINSISFVDQCPLLQSLELRTLTSIVDLSACVYHPKLETLCVDDCDHLVNFDGVSNFFNLKILAMRNIPCFWGLSSSNREQRSSASGCNLSFLRKVEFHNCKHLYDISFLKHSPDILDLSLRMLPALADIAMIRDCPNLRSLSIWCIPARVNAAVLGSQQNLQVFDARGLPNLRDIRFWEECPNLETLTLCSCHSIGALCSFRHWQKLKKLEVSNVSNLVAIVPCSSLQSIKLSCLWKLEDIRFLGQMCPNLRDVCIENCPYVADLSPLGNCPSIRVLKISRCAMGGFPIGPTDIAALARCRSLTELALPGCQGVTDLSPLAMCLSLRNLDIRLCKGITSLATMGPCKALVTVLWDRKRALETVHLKHCLKPARRSDRRRKKQIRT